MFAERNKQIKALLSKASKQFRSDKLTSPPGNNAYDSYQQVLSLEPDNKVALKGIEDIASEYLEQAEELIKMKQ